MTDKPPPSSSEESSAPVTGAPPPAQHDATEDDSDPDFDDLDGTFHPRNVLDQFSANSAAPPASAVANAKAASPPTPSASGPGRPDIDTLHTAAAAATATPFLSSKPEPKPTTTNDPSEEEFMARLNAEMSAFVANMRHDPVAETTSPEQLGEMGKELDEFTERMEKEGVKPEDLLRAILGKEDAERVVDKAAEIRKQSEGEGADGQSEVAPKAKLNTAAAGGSTSRDTKTTTAAAGTNTTFEDTIRKTMERMSTSDATATNAASQPAASEEDMLAQLLQAMETGGADADGEGGDLSKMFLGMMEQLTNKDMLYEPMKELNEKFPEWLAKKEKDGKLAAEDMKRFRNQSVIVREIVGKFEERGYSDDDPQCREFIWERMQKMQDEGSPPEDLVANPLPGMGGLPGLGNVLGEAGEDAACPTQ